MIFSTLSGMTQRQSRCNGCLDKLIARFSATTISGATPTTLAPASLHRKQPQVAAAAPAKKSPKKVVVNPKEDPYLKDFSPGQKIIYSMIVTILNDNNPLMDPELAFELTHKHAQEIGVTFNDIIRKPKILHLIRTRKLEDTLKKYLEFYSPLGILNKKEKKLFVVMKDMLRSYDWNQFLSADLKNPTWNIHEDDWDIDRKLQKFSEQAQNSGLDFKKVLTCFSYGQSLIDMVILYCDSKTHDDESKILRKHGLQYVVQILYELGVPIVSVTQKNPTLESLWKSKSLEYTPEIADLVSFFVENDPEVKNIIIKKQRDTSGKVSYVFNDSTKAFRKFAHDMLRRYPEHSNLCEILKEVVKHIGLENSETSV